ELGRLATVDARREDPQWLPSPACGVHHGLAVRGEPCLTHPASPKRQALELWRLQRRRFPEHLAGKETGRDERRGAERDPETHPSPRRNSGNRFAGARLG